MYALPARSSAYCPCSRGAVGDGTDLVPTLSDLVHSTSPSAISRWPRATDDASHSSMGAQLLWLRKFVHVRVESSAAFPACMERGATLVGPCAIPAKYLLRPVPSSKESARSLLGGRRQAMRGLNLTLSRPAFWMSFQWSRQYAHWILEHLPRMWYYLQLCKLLPRPPVLVTPHE